ncbi:CAF17-like 4Fe-4S cluster assembly/insertion protein YgfZ [Endozoicomonadaceae bacterium StTr2]
MQTTVSDNPLFSFINPSDLASSAEDVSSQAGILTPLTERSLLSAQGPDTERFLQGQFTCNVARLENNTSRPGACCNHKGRMLASFRLIHSGDCYLLSLPLPQGQALQSHLQKYGVFFKSEMSLLSDSFGALGIAGDSAAAALEAMGMALPSEENHTTESEHGILVRLPGSLPRFELWVPADRLEQSWNTLSQSLKPVEPGYWELLNIQSGLAEVSTETREAYIPQHFNLPSVGGVSFKKGCYTGQEIVARMQNLGKLKSRLFRLQLENDSAPAITEALVNADQKSIGEVVTRAWNPANNSWELLAVIREDAADSENVFTKDAVPLSVLQLPYTIDQKADLQRD